MKYVINLLNLFKHLIEILDHGFIGAFVAFFLSLKSHRKQLSISDEYNTNREIKNIVNKTVAESFNDFTEDYQKYTYSISAFMNFVNQNVKFWHQDYIISDLPDDHLDNFNKALLTITNDVCVDIDNINSSAKILYSQIIKNKIYFKKTSQYYVYVDNVEVEINTYRQSTYELSSKMNIFRVQIISNPKSAISNIPYRLNDLMSFIEPTYIEQFGSIYELINKTNILIYSD